MYTYIYACIYRCIYIYIEREREGVGVNPIYIYREREGVRVNPNHTQLGDEPSYVEQPSRFFPRQTLLRLALEGSNVS